MNRIRIWSTGGVRSSTLTTIRIIKKRMGGEETSLHTVYLSQRGTSLSAPVWKLAALTTTHTVITQMKIFLPIRSYGLL